MLSHKTSAEYCKSQDLIFTLKRIFEQNLAQQLNLTKVQAPLYLPSSSGLNDDLNGVEPPVKFSIQNRAYQTYEVIQSLAKWKRFLLAHEKFESGSGLYTDMRALRPSDEIDATHSIYVDQWDWERVMSDDERNITFLKGIVSKIYEAVKATNQQAPNPLPLPETISFVHSEELLAMYPKVTLSKERENLFAKEKGAIFVIGVGAQLSNGVVHDLRAPDYDDWTTISEKNFKGLNGDLILYSPELGCGLEISSMGIRVNKTALLHQLELTGHSNRTTMPFHSKLLNGELPQTIGGGIGQSRLMMLLLRKNQISAVQAELFDHHELQKSIV
jgi:aspartate--ammonia ligase